MADPRFGPNSAQVEAFLERLGRLTPLQWERIMKASPGVGAIPELEVEEAPDYFKAFQEATRIAKGNVFPESESAFYDAMRTAQLVADASSFRPLPLPEPATSARGEGVNLPPDLEEEAMDRVMSTAFEEEAWRRVMNACMVAAGAMVVEGWIERNALQTLVAPFEGLREGRKARRGSPRA